MNEDARIMQEIRTNAGRTIRKIRTVLEKTLEEFASDTDCCRSRVSTIEREGTMDLETMIKMNRFSGKSIFSFIADILPDDVCKRELSLWFKETNDQMITDSIEKETEYRKAAEQKKELAARADNCASDIISCMPQAFDRDKDYLLKIFSAIYHYTAVLLRADMQYKRDGTPVEEGSREFSLMIKKALDKLSDLAVKTERYPDTDVFGWIDYSFPSYSFPYVRELNGLPSVYKRRLIGCAEIALTEYIHQNFPDGRKHRMLKKSANMLMNETSESSITETEADRDNTEQKV